MEFNWFHKDVYLPEPLKKLAMVLQKNMNDDIHITDEAEQWVGNPLFESLLFPAIKDCKIHPVEPLVVGALYDETPFIYASAMAITKTVSIPNYKGGQTEIPFTFHIAMDVSQEYAIEVDNTDLFYVELGSTLKVFDGWKFATRDELLENWLKNIKGWGTVQ